MAKKKETEEVELSAIDKMYAKYRKTDQIFEAPKSLEDIDTSVERLKNPFLSFDRYLGGAPAYGKITTYSAFASCGKCLGKGTKIMMYDGTFKNVEDIEVGEQLMGSDSTPRNVLSLARGQEQMYWIRQHNAIDYRVNESHILSLKKIVQPQYSSYTKDKKRVIDHGNILHDRKENIVNISVKDLITKESKNSVYKTYKGYRAGSIDFSHIDKEDFLKIPPYLLGLWLGDGTSTKPEITNIDAEIINYLYQYAEDNNQKITVYSEDNKTPRYNIVTDRGQDNPFLQYLQHYKLINNKHIPFDYMFSNIENRLELLAGLLDSDGNIDNNTRFEITQKSDILAENIVTLARSCGLHVIVTKKKSSIKKLNFEGIYNRVQISGDILRIPVKVERKKPKERDCKRNTIYSAIKIEKDIVDNYYGFEIDGDKLFLLEDLTVTHNTSLALAIAGANPDKVIGFCDNEFNFSDSSYLWIDKYFGIEKERIHVLQPTYLEEGAEMVEDLCEVADIVIFDGFDSLAPKSEYQATMEDQQMGAQARAYKKFFRRSMGKIYKSKASLIITNHLYENIGNVFEPFKEPGGRAIHDFASQKLYLTRSNTKDTKTGKTTGQEVNVTINKDKLSGNRGTKFSLPYDNKIGFDIELDILNNAVDLGIVKQSGSYFSYEGTNIGQGKDKTTLTLRDNPELCLEIITLCKEKF